MTRRADRDLPPKHSQLFGNTFNLVHTRNQAGYGALLVQATQHAVELHSITQGRVISRSKLNAVHAAAARAVERAGTEPITHEEIDAHYEAQQAPPLEITTWTNRGEE